MTNPSNPREDELAIVNHILHEHADIIADDCTNTRRSPVCTCKQLLDQYAAKKVRAELEYLKAATRKAYAHRAVISIESMNAEMAVHTNSLIEARLAAQTNGEGDDEL